MAAVRRDQKAKSPLTEDGSNTSPEPYIVFKNEAYTSSTYRGQPQTPRTSHTAPQWLQARADQWNTRESLKNAYNVHKRKCARAVDPVAQKAVAGMDISRFVQPTTTSNLVPAENRASGLPSLFHPGPPLEDLNYSLRNFVVADPVQDPNALYATIAIREGRTVVGFVPALPQSRRPVTGEVSNVAECGEKTGEQ